MYLKTALSNKTFVFLQNYSDSVDIVIWCAPLFPSQPPKVLVFVLRPASTKLLYDSDANVLHSFKFNAKLFTSLINGFVGQTKMFFWFSKGGWLTPPGWVWAFSRSEPGNEKILIKTFINIFQFPPYPSHHFHSQRCVVADDINRAKQMDSVVKPEN